MSFSVKAWRTIECCPMRWWAKSLYISHTITEEDGRKSKNIYIDLILKTIAGLRTLNLKIEICKNIFLVFKGQKKRLESIVGTSFPQLFWQVKNLNYFYSLFLGCSNRYNSPRDQSAFKIFWLSWTWNHVLYTPK